MENHGKLVEHLWEHFYEDKLYEPTFVRDFPVETSPLVKGHRTKPGVVEKWDLYVRGFELATGYSELNDPIVQRERFVAQAKDALAGDEEPATSMRTSSRLSAWACLRQAAWAWVSTTAYRLDRCHDSRDHHLPAGQAARWLIRHTLAPLREGAELYMKGIAYVYRLMGFGARVPRPWSLPSRR